TDLLFDPGADLVEDSVVIESLGDESAAGDELDHCAQNVGRAAIDAAHVDRVDAQDDGEHPEARDDVGLVGEIVEDVADTEALWARCGALADGEGLALKNVLRGLVSLSLVGSR